MFEYHAWINVQYHAHDTDAELQQECWEQVVAAFESLDLPLSDYVRYNGMDTIHYAGQHNRARDDVLRLFHEIGSLARGSYGSMSVRDDEHKTFSNHFQVYTMAKGKVSLAVYNGLSPCVPTIEDPNDECRDD